MTEAYSTVYQQELLVLAIEATRGMTRLRIARLGEALAGNASSKHKAKRQQANRDIFLNQPDPYASRYTFFDV